MGTQFYCNKAIANFYGETVWKVLDRFELVSCHLSLSIPPETIRKSLEQGGIERHQWHKMG